MSVPPAAAPEGCRVRSAREDDIPQIAAIYAHYVLHGLASFELDPPDVAEMTRRYRNVVALRLPYLVAENGSRVAGYAYAGPYRTRPAYRYTVENSIYVHQEFAGSGVGGSLMQALIEACTAAGCRQMIAVIGDSENWPSIRLHERFGFARVGLLPSVGWKFDRWVDSVLMQRALGTGDTSPADASRIF